MTSSSSFKCGCDLPPESYRFVLPWDEKPTDLDLHHTKDGTLHISCRHMRSIPDLSDKQILEDGARLRTAEDPKRFMNPTRSGRSTRRIQMAKVVGFAGQWCASAPHGVRYFCSHGK
jgi:hypothetical protein